MTGAEREIRAQLVAEVGFVDREGHATIGGALAGVVLELVGALVTERLERLAAEIDKLTELLSDIPVGVNPLVIAQGRQRLARANEEFDYFNRHMAILRLATGRTAETENREGDPQ